MAKGSARIGSNATIVCGVTIGEYSLIGSGTVVTKDVLPFSLVVGNPGKVIGWVDKLGKNIARKKCTKDFLYKMFIKGFPL